MIDVSSWKQQPIYATCTCLRYNEQNRENIDLYDSNFNLEDCELQLGLD